MRTYVLLQDGGTAYEELTFPIQFPQTIAWRIDIAGHTSWPFFNYQIRASIYDGSGTRRVYAAAVERKVLSGTFAVDWSQVGTGRLVLDSDDTYCYGRIEVDVNERVLVAQLGVRTAGSTLAVKVFDPTTVYRSGLRVSTPHGVGALELLADGEPTVGVVRTPLSIATPSGVYRVCT